MKINIYQINSDRDKNNVLFFAYDKLKKIQGTTKIDSKIYDKVFSGEVNCNTLEDVFQMFNNSRPNNFKGHSLSSSDIVEILDDNSQEDKGFHFCDSIGFKKVDFNPELTKDKTQTHNIIEKNVVYIWSGHDFKCSDYYDDNNSIRYNSIEFQERIMEEKNGYGRAECYTFNNPDDAKVFFEEMKKKCKLRVLQSKNMYSSHDNSINGLEFELRVDMCSLEVEKYEVYDDGDEDFISSQVREFHTETITFNKPYYLEVTATEAQILKDKGISFCGKTPKPQSTINTSIIEIAFNDKAKVEKLLNTVRNKNNHTPKP